MQRPPSRLRSFVKRTLPPRAVQAVRLARWHGRALLGRRAQREFARLWAQTRGRVVSGPFAGMRYVRLAPASAWVPKLLGVYELELWEPVERLISRTPELIVNLGAGVGYYAGGLARRLPGARIVAFEAAVEDHDLLRELLGANGVATRVDVRGRCAPGDLACVLSPGVPALVVCDVEGAEDELLDPAGTPALAHADLLVEVYEARRPGVGDRLRERFRGTHTVETVVAVPRVLSDYPQGIERPTPDPVAWISEGRKPGSYWFLLLSKARG